MNRYYDATKEHAPFVLPDHPTKLHPNKHVVGKHPLTGKSGKQRRQASFSA
jgi:hypothetical protein